MKKVILVILGIVILAVIIGVVLTQLPTKKEPEVYKIGAIVFLTGPQAMLGEEVKNGLDIALEEINERGGINGKKLEILYEDSKDSPKDAIMAFQKLLIENPPLIISTGDVVTLNLIPFADKNEIPLLAIPAAGPEITGKSKWIFRFFPRGDYQARIIADYAYKKLEVKKVGILAINNEYGVATSKIFKEVFEKYGGKVIGIETFNIFDKDIRAQIQKLKVANPDAIYLTGFGEGYAVAIKQMREMEYKGLILSSECELSRPPFRALTLPAAEGAYFADVSYDENSTDPKIVNFVRRYKDRFNSIPSFFSAYAYDALKIIASAIEKTGKDKELLRQALLTTETEGLIGKISFKPNGDLDVPIVIKKIQDGKPVILETYESIP